MRVLSPDRTLDATTSDRIYLGVCLAIYIAAMLGAFFKVWLLIPQIPVVSLLGKHLDVGALIGRIFGGFDEYVQILMIVPTLFIIELLLTGWSNSSVRQLTIKLTPSMKTDLLYFLFVELHFMYFASRLMLLFFSIDIGIGVHDFIAAKTGIHIGLASIPIFVQAPLYFLAYTFFDYWAHRLDHTRIFWPLHRFHHAAEDFCMVTAVRAHPVALTGVLIAVPLALLGASPVAILALSVMKNAIGFLSHSRIRHDFGWFGRWVILAPVNHRLHHKRDISEPVGHFGVIPIWDQLFGTFNGVADPELVIGVTERYGHGFSFLKDLVRDYKDFWMALLRRPSKI